MTTMTGCLHSMKKTSTPASSKTSTI
jgi:hypothetical protein